MSLFDLSSFVGILSGDTATVTRRAFSFASTGKAAAPTVASTFAAKVSFQPDGTKKLDRAPEGFNEKADLYSVFSTVELQNMDRLTVNSKLYEVERVEPWNSIGAFCEATVRALDPEES